MRSEIIGLLFSLFVIPQVFSQGFIEVDSLTDKISKKEERKERRALRSRYLQFGFGVSSYKLQDFAVSPLVYKGPLLCGGVNYEVQGQDLNWGIFVEGAFGYLKADYSGAPTMVVNPQITSFYMFNNRKFSGEKVRTYLGGYVMSGGSFRVNNSFFNAGASFYDYLTSYGVTAKLNSGFNLEEKTFKWHNQGSVSSGRFIALDYQLFVPLFHSYLRPDYAVVSNFPSTEATNQPTMKTTSWGTIARLSAEFKLTYYLKNNNAFRFSYKWDAYTVNPGYNKESVANNTYMISLLFRLNKKTAE
jgi:hypothetical protein